MAFYHICRFVILGLCFLSGVLAQELVPFSYRIKWAEKLDRGIRHTLETDGHTFRLQEKPPVTFGGLVRRAQKDKKLFKKLLETLGYFDACVDYTIDQTKHPFVVRFSVKLYERYKIQTIQIICDDNLCAIDNNTTALTYDILGTHPGDVVDVTKLENGKERIKNYFQKLGYPYVDVKTSTGYVNKCTHTVDVTFHVITGPLARIIDTEIEGAEKVSRAFIANRLAWKNGDIYSTEAIQKTKRKLIETGTISTVFVDPVKTTSAETQEVPVKMIVTASEAPPRAIGAGVRYAIYDGVGANLFWQHNNVGHKGDHAGVSFLASKRLSQAKVTYDVVDFFSPEQKLANEFKVLRERSRAYIERSVNIGSSVERPWGEKTVLFGGLRHEISRVRREKVTYNSRLVGVPFGGRYDSSNDLLNPIHGMRVKISITPYYGKLAQTNGMTVTQGEIRHYLPFKKNELGESDVVLASFMRGGSVFIKALDTLPPNKRFYAGGGNSVRGYGHQLLGPLDATRVPIGGRSLGEFGTELRLKTGENFGVVTFVEAATVRVSKMPSFTKNLLWGTGFGLRYYSAIAPIRFDIGIPLTRRKDANRKRIDAPFQLYVSIGQAF